LASSPGAILGSYEDSRFKTEKKPPLLKSFELIGFGNGTELQEKLRIAEKISHGIIFSKELVNAPPNVLTPSMYTVLFSYKALSLGFSIQRTP
jgi:leucyl aminopeptidase